MKYICYITITAFFLTSCATMTNYITLDIREPAAVYFPPEISNVLIVDNTPSMVNVTPDKKGDMVDENKKLADLMSSDSAKTVMLHHLQKFMDEEKYFNKVVLYPHKIINEPITNDKPLSQETIQSLCKENNSDALISFDMFNALAYSEKSKHLTNSDGFNISDGGVLSIKTGVLIRIYSGQGESYTKPRVYYKHHFLWLDDSISKINDQMYKIFVAIADQLTSDFIPPWRMQERWYYSDRSSKMKEATKFVKADKWKEAADVWRELYEKEENTEKKIYLASNIALANEYLDDVENAKDWIDTAYDLLPLKNRPHVSFQIRKYKNILGKRLRNKPLLQEQLGIKDLEELM